MIWRPSTRREKYLSETFIFVVTFFFFISLSLAVLIYKYVFDICGITAQGKVTIPTFQKGWVGLNSNPGCELKAINIQWFSILVIIHNNG